MAEEITVLRGATATHNMHVYPGETPTALWASLEAQNTGVIAGNWQSHLVCTPMHMELEVENPQEDYLNPVQINQWRVRWPLLGSYSHLSFYAYISDAITIDAIVRLWDDSYAATFYAATLANLEFDEGETKRLTFAWDMEESGLSAHLNTNIYVELLGHLKDWENYPNPSPWTVTLNEFALYTANRPL